jgi:hypothetical protein
MKPTPQTSATTLLPGRVDSTLLAKFLLEGEPVIVLKLVGVGNTAPYDFRGSKGTRSFIFRFEWRMEGHILRVPLHLWQEAEGRLAHELMDQRHLAHAMVVLVEQPPTPAAVQTPPSLPVAAQMGATDTRTETRNVVGPGEEPTVAPTCGTASPVQDAPSVNAAQPVQDAPALHDTQPAHATRCLYNDRPLHAVLFDAVDKPKRLKALAAQLRLPESEIRHAATDPDSHIELAASGWLRRKAIPSSTTSPTSQPTAS